MILLVTGAMLTLPAFADRLAEKGHSVYLLQHEHAPVPIPYESIEGVICNGLFLYHPIERFTSLKYIQLTSAGLDRVPMDYIRSNGIQIFNAKDVYSAPMAEFALGGVLQLYKQSRFFAENQKKHRWEKHRGLLELAGKHVCIVGCGSVGRACAERFRAFECYITGVNRTLREDAAFDRILPMDQLNEGLRTADIVLLSLPLTEDTVHLVDECRLQSMKPGAILVNIARGLLVDTGALISALQTHLCGAVLDVFEEEPLGEDSPLWEMENVILTPHNSFVGDGNTNRLSRLIMDNLEKYG